MPQRLTCGLAGWRWKASRRDGSRFRLYRVTLAKGEDVQSANDGRSTLSETKLRFGSDYDRLSVEKSLSDEEAEFFNCSTG